MAQLRRFRSPNGMNRLVRAWRRLGHSVALVPTMGNLHQGHLSLLQRARGKCSKTVASIFINPTQFNDRHDFKNYPRSMRQDLQKLREMGVDAVFTPEAKDMFPHGAALQTQVQVPGISEALCGKHRPRHFTGVTSVVASLFGICQPDIALFGEKDYQQLLLVTRMCQDLRLPVRIVLAPTIRCEDGLAMSSRNSLLSARQRAVAPALYRCLRRLAGAASKDARNCKGLQRAAAAELRRAGFKLEYLQILQQHDLSPPSAKAASGLRAFAAAWLGRVRLIDNVAVPSRK